MIRKAVDRIGDILASGGLGPQFVLIAAIGIPVDVMIRAHEFADFEPSWRMTFTMVRSMLDCFLLAVVWHYIRPFGRRGGRDRR